MGLKRCALCKCDATRVKFGFAVCKWHVYAGEDGPPCPVCNHPLFGEQNMKMIPEGSRISKTHVQHVHKQFQRNPKSVRLPLPVSVFCYRITSTTFGFLSDKDRTKARVELAAFAQQKGYNLGFTTYRDVNGPIAAQISLWHTDGRPGGISIHHGGVLRDCRYRNVITGNMV